MALQHKYAILQIRPFSHREEVINVGVAVFKDDGLDIRVKTPPGLLKHFGVEPDTIDWAVNRIHGHDDNSAPVEDRISQIESIPGIALTGPGWFLVDTPRDYETRIGSIMQQYVEKPKRPTARAKTSQLSSELARVFKEYKVFSRKVEDLEHHKVVPNMPVGPSRRLRVDFILKNSAFHATETLDFRKSDTVGDRELKNAALANVTFRYAKDEFRSNNTRCYLAYAASSIVEKTVRPAINVAMESADDAFNLESRDDKVRYLDTILSAAGSRHLFSESD